MTATIPTLFDWQASRASDICSNRHGGNSESAAANLVTSKERDRARILDYLKTVTDSTCEEASLATGISYQTCSGRFAEMKADGLIVEGSGRRKTTSGCLAKSWKVKP